MSHPYCCGSHCNSAHGEVRFVPTGALGPDGGIDLCYQCYYYEMQWRRYRNLLLGDDCKFKVPDWNDLQIIHKD